MEFASPYIGLAYGVIGVLLFRYKNQNKTHLNSISAFLLLLFCTELLFIYVNEIAGQVVWALSGMGLIVFYIIRLNKNESKIIGYFKLFSVILLALYPLNFYTWELFQIRQFLLIGLSAHFVPIAFAVYVYDRWILKTDKMKTKFVVVLVVQSFIILISFLYAFVQQGIAKENEILAKENQSTAIKIASESLAAQAALDKSSKRIADMEKELARCMGNN